MLCVVVHPPKTCEQAGLITLEIGNYVLRRIAQEQPHVVGKAVCTGHAAAQVGKLMGQGRMWGIAAGLEQGLGGGVEERRMYHGGAEAVDGATLVQGQGDGTHATACPGKIETQERGAQSGFAGELPIEESACFQLA